MRARAAFVVIGLAAIIVLIFVAVWRRQPSSTTHTPTAAAARAERVRPIGCDPLPAVPPLPAALTPKTPTLDGVVQALDASLGAEHKRFLRCLPDDDDLLMTTQFGMGRWLRTTLHLYGPNPLSRSLATAGAKDAEEMSGLILQAYARTLKGKTVASNGGVR